MLTKSYALKVTLDVEEAIQKIFSERTRPCSTSSGKMKDWVTYFLGLDVGVQSHQQVVAVAMQVEQKAELPIEIAVDNQSRRVLSLMHSSDN